MQYTEPFLTWLRSTDCCRFTPVTFDEAGRFIECRGCLTTLEKVIRSYSRVWCEVYKPCTVIHSRGRRLEGRREATRTAPPPAAGVAASRESQRRSCTRRAGSLSQACWVGLVRRARLPAPTPVVASEVWVGDDGVERVGEAGCSCRATIAGDDAAPNGRGGVGEEAVVLVSSVYERAVGVVSSDRERLRCGRAQTGRKGFSEEIGQGCCVLLCQSGEFVGRHRHACRYRTAMASDDNSDAERSRVSIMETDVDSSNRRSSRSCPVKEAHVWTELSRMSTFRNLVRTQVAREGGREAG